MRLTVWSRMLRRVAVALLVGAWARARWGELMGDRATAASAWSRPAP